jgi:hypothetical protein
MHLRLEVYDDTDPSVFWYIGKALGTETFTFSAQ